MNELQVINEQEEIEKEFRVYGTIDEPLFLAKDVATWIEHSNPRMMLKKIDEDEKVVNNIYTLGGIQETWFLTENGLYEVLMQSRKPIAKEFKKKVKEILKELRKGNQVLVNTGNREADLYTQLMPTDWTEVDNSEILQPEEAREGDKYIVYIKEEQGQTSTIDAKFLVCRYEEDQGKNQEEKTITETVKLPVTYDSIALIVALAIIILAIIIVAILKLKANKKEKNS